jgi:large conductance mechanosensitive channel
MWKEFKEFVLKGNVFDLAVGIILGIAFGAVVTSLVNDVIMPPIGMLLGKMDFSSLFVSLNGQHYASLLAAKAAGAPVISYGMFINTIINFLIVAFVIFLMVRSINKYRTVSAAPKPCPYCATNIPAAAVRCPNCTSELPS